MSIQKELQNNKKKKYNTRSVSQAKNLKKNVNSDSDDDDDDDSKSIYSDSEDEDAMDIHEYRKFLGKIFPSKYISNKIKTDAKTLKNQSKEDDNESEEYSDQDDSNNKLISKTKKNKSKFIKNKNRQPIKPVKNKQEKKKKNVKEESESEDIEDTEDDSDDEDYESDDSSQLIEVLGKNGKFNITFTINENDSEYDSEYDSDYDEDESEEESEEDSEEEECDEDNEEGATNIVNAKNKTTENLEDERIKQQETFTEIRKTFQGILEKDAHNKIAIDGLKDLDTKEKKFKNEYDKKMKKQKMKNIRSFKNLVNKKNLMDDYNYFKNKLSCEEQSKVLKEVEEINKINIVQKPYRLTLLEADIPTNLKSIALNKISSLRHMDPSNSEYYKVKNWVDTFMQIPFNRYNNLPLHIDDGIEVCHEYMSVAKNTLDKAVYGLNDAKIQIMQMIGQWISNPSAIGSAIAIKGPMGTGKTTLVKDGISKILNREFAFIALGGATDSSCLEGHSYTYEGSTWGKIVDILVKTKSMNPVIYFDELDKISDTPKGEEITGILTHLTDTTQNTQFHDKYFSEIDFDLSKCLFIFSYNDESKVNPILLDRMYKIQTKGYEKVDKRIISKDYLIPTIIEQVNFKEDEIIIPEESIDYIVENYTEDEKGVRNLKRCLEIIYTKLNLYRLMKPGSNLFENELTLTVEFPMTVTPEVIRKLIKLEDKSYLYKTMYI
jgi:ATP-dependent Lon protease